MKHAHNILVEDDLWAVATASGNASAYINEAIAAEHERRIAADTAQMMAVFAGTNAEHEWSAFVAERTAGADS